MFIEAGHLVCHFSRHTPSKPRSQEKIKQEDLPNWYFHVIVVNLHLNFTNHVNYVICNCGTTNWHRN